MDKNLENYLISLGVDPVDKKLPYCLKVEEVYPQYQIHDGFEGLSISQIEPMILQGAAELAAFLNNPSSQFNSGKAPEITEEVFVRSWLPFFYGEQKPQGYEDNPIVRYQVMHEGVDSVVKAWVSAVSGSVYNAVNVTRHGEVIYMVPPIIDKPAVVGGKDRKKSVAQLYQDAKQVVDRIPSKAVLNAQFNHMVESIRDYTPESRKQLVNRINYKYLFVMDEIFTYYGYDSILTPEIMLIKNDIMGYTDEHQSSGTVSQSHSEPDFIEDDEDDLFGA